MTIGRGSSEFLGPAGQIVIHHQRELVMTTVEIIRNVFRSGFDLGDLDWTPWVEPGRIGVEHYTLRAPDGDHEDSVGLLLRFPPGAHGDFHEHLD